MIDSKFTEQIARWLQSDHTGNKAIADGAMLLLRVNRDQAMYQRIMRRPQHELKFLEYKLRRILKIRQDGNTMRDVVKMDREITPMIEKAVASDGLASDTGMLPDTQPSPVGYTDCVVVRKGIRPDHDKLPADIQAIWPKNAERWKKIKEAFETCKSLTEPCDRYEYLKVLKETWYKYKQEMARYDDYRLTADNTTVPDGSPSGVVLAPEQEKQVANARSYISKNLQGLLTLYSRIVGGVASDQDKQNFQKKQGKVTERVELLLSLNQPIGDELKSLLKEVEISTDVPVTPQDNEQGQESE